MKNPYKWRFIAWNSWENHRTKKWVSSQVVLPKGISIKNTIQHWNILLGGISMKILMSFTPWKIITNKPSPLNTSQTSWKSPWNNQPTGLGKKLIRWPPWACQLPPARLWVPGTAPALIGCLLKNACTDLQYINIYIYTHIYITYVYSIYIYIYIAYI